MTQDERRRVIPLATRAALASVAMACFLLLLKGFAAWTTGSVAMLGSLADSTLDLVASPRDAAVWLSHADERATGNRSPAVTVAARFGLGEAAVRKVVQRVGQRLRALGGDDRFPDLLHLPVVAARRAA